MTLQKPIKDIDDENIEILEDWENEIYDDVLEFQEIEKAEEDANMWHKVQAYNDENRKNDWDYDVFNEEYFEN